MPSKTHLQLLKEDYHAWNRWRRDNPDIVPDLQGADLTMLHCRKGVNLSGAVLDHAIIRCAVIPCSSFRGASLLGALIEDSDLSGSNLEDAKLQWARIGGSELSGATFRCAHFLFTHIAGLDLAKVVGLDSVHHHGPSFVTIDTLLRARGHVPRAFLEGLGLPDHLVTYFADKAGEAIYCSCFISYSQRDKEFARKLCAFLQTKGIRCWRDEVDLCCGEDIREGIWKALRAHDRVLLCCSRASLTSPWVEEEIRMAVEVEFKGVKVLIPLNLDDYLFTSWDSAYGPRIRSRLAADFRSWQQDGFETTAEKLVEALRISSLSDAATGVSQNPTPAPDGLRHR